MCFTFVFHLLHDYSLYQHTCYSKGTDARSLVDHIVVSKSSVKQSDNYKLVYGSLLKYIDIFHTKLLYVMIKYAVYISRTYVLNMMLL